MLFHYPVLNMTGFTYPKFNFVVYSGLKEVVFEYQNHQK